MDRATSVAAIGRIGSSDRWVGLAPTAAGSYDLVIGDGELRRRAADVDTLLALAIAYFEDALDEPPDELAATHADIAAAIRHAAVMAKADRSRADELAEAVDAVDDGLGADVVISRLTRSMSPAAASDPVRYLLGIVDAVAEGD